MQIISFFKDSEFRIFKKIEDFFKSNSKKKSYKDRIFVYGHYGCNVGDNAMIYALLESISNLKPFQIDFYIMMRGNGDFLPKIENNIKLVSYYPFGLFKEIFKSKTFIIGGGTHFTDRQGKNFQRFTITLKQISLILFAKIFCENVYFVGTGIEKPTRVWSKTLFKYIFNLADLIFSRDSRSVSILSEIGVDSKKSFLSFDLSILLKDLNINSMNFKDDFTIGISVLPYYFTNYGDKKADELFLNKLAYGINTFLKQNYNTSIKLFLFSFRSKYGDLIVTEYLKNQIDSTDVEIIPFNPNPIEVLEEVSKCDVFAGMRYHSCLFAYLTKKPLLIIEGFEKDIALANEIISQNSIVTRDEILNGKFLDYLNCSIEKPEIYLAKLPLDKAKERSKLFHMIFR